MPLPLRVDRSVIGACCGEVAAQLPATLAACLKRWNLVIGERLSGGLVGHVFACVTRSGEAAVLKLNPPSSAQYAGTTEQQALALRAWAGRGAVALLEFAPDLGALLTRRAIPGTSLDEDDEDEAIRSVAAVLGDLFQARHEDFAAHLEITLRRALRGRGIAAEIRFRERGRRRARSLV